ncbi:hypothetical protein [Streptomyces sp. NRRL S-337]|uniref:hypothetical protein n=1 Tax=Streptomyces sp. NRRL S-337 TaxID=1463900 RepID=UPI003B6401FE
MRELIAAGSGAPRQLSGDRRGRAVQVPGHLAHPVALRTQQRDFVAFIAHLIKAASTP